MVSLLPELAELPVFVNVAPALMKRVTPPMVTYFVQGVRILRQGETAQALYVLIRGRVTISVNEIFIVERGPGAVLGEQAFLNDRCHSADVVALGAGQVLRLPAALAQDLLRDPAFALNLLTQISDKLREATADRYIINAEHQRLFSQFSSHVSPEVRDRLLRDGIDYGTPQYVDDAMILFADIRDFTRISALVGDPLRVAESLSRYFDAVAEIIKRAGGFVDKFVGDLVMAVWGYPGLAVPSADDVLAAARAMIRIARALRFGDAPIRIGVGLNRGRVFMGNIGSDRKRQFTVMGDAVNLASRFEAQTKAEGLGRDIVIGPDFYAALSSAARAGFNPRERPIKGAGTITLYVTDVEELS